MRTAVTAGASDDCRVAPPPYPGGAAVNAKACLLGVLFPPRCDYHAWVEGGFLLPAFSLAPQLHLGRLPAGESLSIQLQPWSVYNATILGDFATIAVVKWAGFFAFTIRREPLVVSFFLFVSRPFA